VQKLRRKKDFPTWCHWRAPSLLRNHLWYCELLHHFRRLGAKTVCYWSDWLYLLLWKNYENHKHCIL